MAPMPFLTQLGQQRQNEDNNNKDNDNEDNDNEDNNNKDNYNKDNNNDHDYDEYRGPNCDVRAVSQFCDVFFWGLYVGISKN